MQLTEILLLNTPQTVYAEQTDNYKLNQRVVVKIDENLDLGIIKNSNSNAQSDSLVEIIRLANNLDNKKNCENCCFTRSVLPEIKKEAEKLNLDMKIGIVSTNLDRSKLIINYTAEERVDFRELIKILGTKYKTRIEMRQIGNRDETKMIGALGICGRVTCCKSFLSDFDKVSIKMAKNQNISLNPSKINGMCGRLLCCFKYEDEFYEEMQKKMPKINSVVSTPDGKGIVSSTDFLKEQVNVEFKKEEDITEIKTYDLKDISFKK